MFEASFVDDGLCDAGILEDVLAKAFIHFEDVVGELLRGGGAGGGRVRAGAGGVAAFFGGSFAHSCGVRGESGR